MEVVERRERPREVRLDESQDSAPGLQTDLDVDARAILDVVLGGLHQPRYLPQFRDDASGTFCLGCIGKERLAGQTGPDHLGIDLWIPVPGPDYLQLVHPGFDVRRDDRMLDLFDRGKQRRVDLMEAPAEPRQRPYVGVNGGTTQVLEQVVMDVNTIQPRVAG